MTSRLVRSAALAVVAAVVAAALTVTAGGGVPEALFGSVILFALLTVLDHGRRSWRIAGAERARARELAGVDPAAAARDAVVAERRRLSDDIAAGLRTSLGSVRTLAARAGSAADPTPLITDIARESRGATGELRRHLGLLRDPPAPPGPATDIARAAAAPDRTDLLIAAAVTGLAVVEAIAYPRIEGLDRPVLSVVLTGLAAASIVARRTAPGAAALVVGLMYLAALAFDAPITDGFWCLATIGGLLWTIAARVETGGRDGVRAAVLVLAAGTSSWLLDPDNAALLTAIMVTALVGGTLARLARTRARLARVQAQTHRREITLATQAALVAERAAFAREIHDTVSHAVGLIAVQAAAAEVSWPGNPAGVRAALRVIEETATSTLTDLDRLPPQAPARCRSSEDIEQLVDRVRAAGTPVRVDGLQLVPAELMDVSYRVIQETLTNVLRHSPGASAAVTITADDADRLITVADDGAGAGRAADRGYGLIGLAERVGFVGGRLTIGTSDAGGFEVRVTLPLTPDRVST